MSHNQSTHFNGSNPNDKNLSKVYDHKQPRKVNTTCTYSHVRHDGAQGDPRKWEMPGWRIEQDYSKKTLIGNWCEERNTVEHNNVNVNSTNRTDFTDIVKNTEPRHMERRHALRRNEGSADKYQIQLGGTTSSNISWYDCDYRRTQNKALRCWNRHKLVWEPEYSDHPLQGSSTQLGIRQRKFQKWKDEHAVFDATSRWCPSTTYGGDFHSFKKTAYPLRYAQSSKVLSSQMNPISRTNKNLPLRGLPLLCPPERQPTEC